RQVAHAEAGRQEAARQLDRRISELFSLQELSYVLAESIQLERVVDQVARYGARFLQADGALVALFDPDGTTLRVAAAAGTLAPLLAARSAPGDSGVVRVAVARERMEVAQATGQPVVLFGQEAARSAAVAPLRSQGRAIGALAVADRREGPFTTEDLWLLSTIATQTSMAVANSRLFEMVRRSTEEWETAFDALTEGLGVVGPDGQGLRANSALATLAGGPPGGVVGAPFTGRGARRSGWWGRGPRRRWLMTHRRRASSSPPRSGSSGPRRWRSAARGTAGGSGWLRLRSGDPPPT